MQLQVLATTVLLGLSFSPAIAEVKLTDIATAEGLAAKGPGSKLGDQVNDTNPGCGQSGSCKDVCLTLDSNAAVDTVEPRVRTKGYEWAKCWRHRDGLWWDCTAEHFRFYPGEPQVFLKEGHKWVCMQARNWGTGNLEVQLVVTYHSPAAPPNPTASVRTYTVAKGDTLASIALRLNLGSDWFRLYSANRRTIRDADSIRPGDVLVVP